MEFKNSHYDDNNVNLMIIKGLLKETNVKITTVLSGEEALELMQKEEYHIIFMDHMMPGMDGVETLQQSKALPDNKCVNSKKIALTANAVAGAKEMFLSYGFDGYLSKPVDPKKLEKMVMKNLPKELVTRNENVNTSGKKADSPDISIDESYIEKINTLFLNKQWEQYEICAKQIADGFARKDEKVAWQAKSLWFACKEGRIGYVEEYHEGFIRMLNEII